MQILDWACLMDGPTDRDRTTRQFINLAFSVFLLLHAYLLWFDAKLEGNGPVERAGRQCTEAVNGLRQLRFNTFINK